MKRIALLLLLVSGCSSAPSPSLPPCYGTFPSATHACSGDWTGIESVKPGTSDAPATSTALCACPEYTACFKISQDLVACALTAGN